MVVSIGSTIAVSWSRGTALAKWLVWTVGVKTVDGVEEANCSRDCTWGERTGCGEHSGRCRLRRVLIESDPNFP